MSLATRMAEIPGIDLTREQRDRIIACARETNGKRRFAKRVSIYGDIDKIAGVEERPIVNCRDCEHITAHNSILGVGNCYALRQRVATWHPVLCNGFRAAA